LPTDDRAETDRLWNAIASNGGPEARAARRVFEAMMTMKRIDIAAIEKARRG
jgi:2-polyprenyl-6-hydroxyphenyl methylase/3-demethylubiquinone-9 3-methyltransferase